MKCVALARLDCAAAAWDILCERLDSRSFARSLSLLDNMMVRQRPGQSLSDYVHYMRQTFDDYSETYEMVDGSAAIHPHNLGLLMLRGISNNGLHGQAKQCVINAFDTYYMLSADEVMANIPHLPHNMDEDDAPDTPAPNGSPPPIYALVAAGRGSHSGRGHPPRGPRGGRGLPNKCSACGSLDHIMSSCTTPDDALLRWTNAKRKMIIQKYGAPSGSHSAHAALQSDVPADDSDSLSTLEVCTDEYDDTEVSFPFSSVAFSSSLTLGRNLSQSFFSIPHAQSTSPRLKVTSYDSHPPPLPRALEGLELTSKVVAPCRFLSSLPLAGLFTAQSMHCTPLACPLALLSASPACLV
jgi:hypothetical protein